MWDSIKKGLSTIAPMVGTALGGPFGGLAGTLLGQAFGVDDPTDEESLEKACQQAMADPDLVMKFKLAEKEFVLKMKELDIKEEDLHVEDRKSARRMQERTKSYIPGSLAILISSGFFGLLAFLCFFDIPVANEKVLYVMIGALGTAWTQVGNFYYGSSKGSQDKNKILGGGNA